MKHFKPHNLQKAARRAALARAAMLDVALCLMGLILYLQANSIVWLIAGAALGMAIFTAALVRYWREGNSARKFERAAAQSRQNADGGGSNVTPFRKPSAKQSSDNSNRTSA